MEFDMRFQPLCVEQTLLESGLTRRPGQGDSQMAATIMLVDADAVSSSDWKAFLQNQGYRVVEIETGKTAIQRCPDVKPDLVLLNATLPDIPGFQVCKRLKADPVNRLMPVIMIVSNSDSEPFEASRACQSGADDFWSKPTSRWEVLHRVETILQLKTYIDQQAEDVLYALARSIELKIPPMAGHSDRLADCAVRFGEHLGLSQDELKALRAASVLHDIGKVAVPDRILMKPEGLSPDEMQIVRQHPVVGEEICAPLKSFRHLLPLIRHHHERTDGSGYPDGLMGDSIPLGAQILQMADIFDALTTNRPYRKELSTETAMAIMHREASQGLLCQKLFREFSIFVWSTNPWQSGGGRALGESRVN